MAAGCAVGAPEWPNPAEVQRAARIPIPASATSLRWGSEHGIDSLTYGRFEIPAGDLKLVLAGMPAQEQIRPYTGWSNVTAHKMSETWWQPELLRDPRVAEWSSPGFSVNLMFGESGQPGVVTVYFFNFTL
jgi:hypothetical protein